MAKDQETKSTAAVPPAPVFVRPTGLTNIAAKYPKFDGGDARVLKENTKVHPIHGYLLAVIDLPSTIKDPATGQFRPWTAAVFELIQAAPVEDPDGTKRMAAPGERMIVTESAALGRYLDAADDPFNIHEFFIEPMTSRTKTGMTLWVYPTVETGRHIPRTEKHRVGFTLPTTGAPAPQLQPPTNINHGAGQTSDPAFMR
jgi:hypothetical protein